MPRAHHAPNSRTLRASVARPEAGEHTWDASDLLRLRPDEVDEQALWQRYMESVPGSDEAARLLEKLKGHR